MCLFIFISVRLISVDSVKQNLNLNENWSIRIIIIFNVFFSSLNCLLKSLRFFLHIWRGTSHLLHFTMFLAVIISTFILLKAFYLILFSYDKMTLGIPYASYFSKLRAINFTDTRTEFTQSLAALMGLDGPEIQKY